MKFTGNLETWKTCGPSEPVFSAPEERKVLGQRKGQPLEVMQATREEDAGGFPGNSPPLDPRASGTCIGMKNMTETSDRHRGPREEGCQVEYNT